MVEVSAINVQLMGCLEETVDKLKICGQIMPLTYEMKKNAKQILSENINDIRKTQQDVEAQFSQALSLGENMKNVTKNLKVATHSLNRAFKQNPFGTDVFEKIEAERLFLESSLITLVGDLGMNQLHSFRQIVASEKTNKIEFQNVIKREEESKEIIKDLQISLNEIKQEKEVEIQKRNELIAHLKDRLQELKAKTNMEAKYVKKSTDNSVSQTKKKCDLTENELKQQIEKLQEQIDQENRCNAELESFLKTTISKLKQMTDQWSDKSEKETLQKQIDLENLKTARTKDLERYQHLAKTFYEYEKVVLEDRYEKDIERKKAEQEKLELEATLKIQNWWKTQMFRYKLGPYGKKKKGKKGKKKSK